jgi:hypothetical protein
MLAEHCATPQGTLGVGVLFTPRSKPRCCVQNESFGIYRKIILKGSPKSSNSINVAAWQGSVLKSSFSLLLMSRFLVFVSSKTFGSLKRPSSPSSLGRMLLFSLTYLLMIIHYDGYLFFFLRGTRWLNLLGSYPYESTCGAFGRLFLQWMALLGLGSLRSRSRENLCWLTLDRI